MTTPTLLATVQRSFRKLGLTVPTVIVADTTVLLVQQALEIANETGTFLMREYQWPFLRKLGTITTVNGTATYTITSGTGATEYTCDRLIDDTQWDETNQWRFVGSVGDDDWYAWQYGVMTEPIRRIWRLISRTQLEMFPTPTADGELLQVPFITDKWATDPTGLATFKAAFTTDADLHLFDWDLFDKQFLWRLMEAKKLDYSVALKQATDMLDQRIAAMQGTGTLTLTRRRYTRMIGLANVPETGYGS